MKVKIGSINLILLYLFVFTSVIFPNDFLGIKKTSFFILLLINIKLILNYVYMNPKSIISFFGFYFPLILMIYSLILTGDLILSFNRSYSPFILLLLIVIMQYNINYEKILYLGISIVLIITLLIFLLDVIKLVNVNTDFPFRTFIVENDIGIMGKSPSYPLYYKIFMKTSPLITILLFNSYKNKKWIIFVLSCLVLLISGTRANFIFPCIMLLIYVILNKDKKKSNKLFLIFIILIFSIIYASSIFNTLIEILVSKGAISDVVRFGHIEGLLEQYHKNPLTLIFGTGMGSYFYSYGAFKYVNSIELPYLDLFRQMGLIFFLLYMYFLAYPIFYKKNNHKLDFYKKCIYMSHLMIAATNPLLFSSTAYLVYLYIYNDLINKKIERRAQ